MTHIQETTMSAQPLPLVSVLCASYNHADYIAAALRSVLTQTYPNIELIVIDDGSKDDSPRIIAELQRQYGFRFETQANQGLAATLNRAIDLSSGKYVAQIGSDDLFLPEKIATQVRYLESRPDIALCGGNMLAIDAQGQPLPKQKRHAYRELDFDDLFCERQHGIPASSAMIRREVLEREGAYDPAIRLEDMYLWFKLLSRGHRMAGLEETLIHYRKHGHNTYRNYRFMHDNMMATYAPYRDHPQYEAVINRYRLSSILALAKHGDKPLARELLKQVPPAYRNRKWWRGLWHAWKPF